ncbi:SdpI family protein [Bacillus velezensis]|nr:SdpI family protein [Bacillus velezensis]
MIMVIGGLLMVAAGISVTFFPPKSINSLYGYRTKRSMADESQWKEGNRFSALLMILFGLISAAGFAGDLLIRLTQPFALIVQAVLLIAISVLIIVLTERRLKQTGRRIDE